MNQKFCFVLWYVQDLAKLFVSCLLESSRSDYVVVEVLNAIIDLFAEETHNHILENVQLLSLLPPLIPWIEQKVTCLEKEAN
jgi:hypothetical protein